MATTRAKALAETNFQLERETKNTYRFQELNEAGDVADASEYLIGTLYLQKSLFPDGKPDRIKVTVESA